MEYLLEKKFVFHLNNIEAYLIGFRSLIKTANFEMSNYRNNPIPSLSIGIQHVILLSSITLNSLQLGISPSKIEADVANLRVNLSYQLLLYELTTGRGKNLIGSIINIIGNRSHHDVAVRKSKRKSTE